MLKRNVVIDVPYSNVEAPKRPYFKGSYTGRYATVKAVKPLVKRASK